MATALQLTNFIYYLDETADIALINGKTYGQPYVIGGQHLHLTPQNYIAQIHAREANTGGYGYITYEQAAKDYCKRLFDNGLTDLYAYDCSGLGMYWWQNVEHEYDRDMNANSMMYACDLYKERPRRGWWVFHVQQSSGRATHVGYMVNDTTVVQALGRLYGVTRSPFKASEWNRWGIPKILKGVIPAPGDPTPGHESTPSSTTTQTTSSTQAEAISFLRIKVRGGRKRTVNVRKGPSTDFPILMIARGGESFPLLAVSPTTGWYKIETPKGVGYITNKTKYTDMEANT